LIGFFLFICLLDIPNGTGVFALFLAGIEKIKQDGHWNEAFSMPFARHRSSRGEIS